MLNAQIQELQAGMKELRDEVGGIKAEMTGIRGMVEKSIYQTKCETKKDIEAVDRKIEKVKQTLGQMARLWT